MQAMQIKMVEVFPMNATLQIPVYQRNYDWRQEQCEQLFKDIETIARDGGTHFLGAIVYKDKKISGMFNELIIVDGQQRITSLILLARALYDSTDDQNIQSAIKANFFRHAVSNPKYPFKLQPTEYDVDIFKKILSGEELEPREKFSRLYESYRFFKDRIAASEFSVEQIHNAMYSLEFVRMVIDNEKPQQIFESMNSTGKDLTETEKIRNFLLMDLDDAAQERLYKEYWLLMERLFNSSETVDKFMLQYLTAKRKSSKDTLRGKNIQNSTNALYETFRNYFRKTYGEDNKAQHVEEFLRNLLFNAKFYRRLLFTAADNFEQLSALDKKFYELVYLLDATNSPIILMALNERYTRGDFDAKTFIQIADALISLNCRAKVCRKTGVDTAQNAGNILNRLDKFSSISADSIWQAVTQGKGKYTVPGDEDFRQALMNPELNVSLKNFCKYLLYSFERNLNHAYNFAGYGDLSVEPVIPKKLSAAWEKYLRDKHDSTAGMLANALGNLVLIANPNKPAAAFSEKRAAYANSKFSYTKELTKLTDWTSRHIRHRTEFFARFALKIWILPEEYQPAVLVDRKTYDLDSDFGELTNTYPESLTIADKKIQLDSWIDLLRKISKELYTLDRETFKQAVHDAGREKIFSASSEKFPNSFYIDENYYLDSRFGTKKILQIVKELVENFDRLAGTNFKDEIEFTRK